MSGDQYPTNPTPAPGPRLVHNAETADTEEITEEGLLHHGITSDGVLLEDEDFLAVAKSDASGRVTFRAGDLEAETVCALAAMATAQTQRACEGLGLGSLEAWYAVDEEQTWFFAQSDGELGVAIGPPQRNPVDALIKFAKRCREL